MSRIFYTDSGKGTPVVFLHGFCESHKIWIDFIAPFSNDIRILNVDMPGFGASPLPTNNLSIDSVGLSIIEWLEELKISNAVLIGHSLGGYVALAIAEQRPDLISGFALFHSTAYADSEEKKVNRNRTIEFVRKNGVAPFIDAFVPGLFFKKDHPATSIAHKIGVQTSSDTLIAYTELMRDRPDRTNVLKNFNKPVLVLAGVRDSIIPFNSLKEQVTFLQKPTFTVLDESAHMGLFEQPETSRKAIQKFIFSCEN
jgi:pimeloyl-ACP methyl ester carboxylesterase